MTALGNRLLAIRKKPGAWLGKGERRLSAILAFVSGFQHGQDAANDPFHFQGFTQWVAARYKVHATAIDGFSLIREKVGGDEKLAFEEFFHLLPDYLKDYELLGERGIAERYRQAMKEIGTGKQVK